MFYTSTFKSCNSFLLSTSLKLLSIIEIYTKMSEVSNFWLSVLISQMPPYLMHTRC